MNLAGSEKRQGPQVAPAQGFALTKKRPYADDSEIQALDYIPCHTANTGAWGQHHPVISNYRYMLVSK